MSPIAEKNQQPPSTSYGEGVKRQEFEQATAPVESPVATPAEPVEQPATPVEPQAFQAGEEKFQPPPEDLVAGQPLAADAMQALFQPGLRDPDDEGVPNEVASWLPFLEELAGSPGATAAVKDAARWARRLLA